MMSTEPLPIQPLLPQVRLVWTFALVTGAALLIALVRASDQGQALVWAIVGMLLWLAGLFSLFGLLFLVTYAFGRLENLVAPPDEEVLSPFASDRFPEQIVTPVQSDVAS